MKKIRLNIFFFFLLLVFIYASQSDLQENIETPTNEIETYNETNLIVNPTDNYSNFKRKNGSFLSSTLNIVEKINLFKLDSLRLDDSSNFSNYFTKSNTDIDVVKDTADERYMVYGKLNFFFSDDFSNFKALVDEAKNVGFNLIRMHVPWYILQPKSGEIDFSRFDEKFDYVINTLGLKAAVTVDLTRMFSDGSDSVLPASDCMIDSNGQVSAIEVWGGFGERNQFALASDNALEKAVNIVRAIVRRYNSRYPTECILYYQVTFSQYCESEYFPNNYYDYSDIAKQKYKDWLQLKYSSISELNSDWGTSYTSFNDVEPPLPFEAPLDHAKIITWYQFCHAMLKRAIDRCSDAIHNEDPNLKFCVQVGSVWDTMIRRRGTLAFTDLFEKTDIVMVDDWYSYDHCFSMDLLRGSLPGKWIANEVDGPWTGADDTAYYNQALQSFQHGAKFVAFANWEDPTIMHNHRQLFIDTAQLLKDPVPTGDPERQQLHMSALDVHSNGSASYRSQYNTMSSNGSLWVDVILDDDLTLDISFSISGKVTVGGVGCSGVVMSGITGNPTTNALGQYSTTVNYGWSGAIIPTKEGYTFSPQNRTFNNVSSDYLNQDYTAEVSLRITSPNGNENWLVGSSQTITWTPTSASESERKFDPIPLAINVKIEYSNDNGSNWSTVASSTPNDGTHPWTVPNAVSSLCLIKVGDAADSNNFDISDAVFSIIAPPSIQKDDLLGTWNDQGVYYKNSDTGEWVYLASPADKISAGDLDGDGIDDLIGIWSSQGGVWIFYSGTQQWALLSTTADWIGSGDMNGDGRVDLLGTWTGQGVYYRDGVSGVWVHMATSASQIVGGDLDGDGKDDVIGIWPSQGGVWVKYSTSGAWALISSTADWIGAGDMNGDGRVDLLGTWAEQGAYCLDSVFFTWTYIGTPASQITCGDLDGDETDDLVGIWPGQGGVWVKYSSTGQWALLSTTADWIGTGHMRQAGSMPQPGQLTIKQKSTFFMDGPDLNGQYLDYSDYGPGGSKFVYIKSVNTIPGEVIDKVRQDKIDKVKTEK